MIVPPVVIADEDLFPNSNSPQVDYLRLFIFSARFASVTGALLGETSLIVFTVLMSIGNPLSRLSDSKIAQT